MASGTQPPTAGTEGDPAAVAETFAAIQSNVEKVIEGKSDSVRLALIALLAEGHLLIEDVPGVGKTMLAKALARSIDCSVRRIQFTPDLLPSDVTGVSVYNQEQADFEFKPGAIFANIVLGDEINRASPKTQSALLESMEERQVTMDGVTYQLGVPFMVIATQNPIEHQGTYPLPEAQRDRFLMQLEIGYPTRASELDILRSHGHHSTLEDIGAVADAPTIAMLIDHCRAVHVAESLEHYIVDLIRATREHADLTLGASPRAALALLRASRAAAVADGRDFVLPDDVQELAVPVLAHRLISAPEAQMVGHDTREVLATVMDKVPVPVLSKENFRDNARGNARNNSRRGSPADARAVAGDELSQRPRGGA